jgi:Icc-related predicted phosphoesterase
MPLFGAGRARRKPDLTLFFATDLHGSDVCFKKFLSAKRAYDADVLILGGDLTGKLAIPIVQQAGSTYEVCAPGRSYDTTADALPAVQDQLSRSGFYWFIASPEEIEEYRQNHDLVQQKLDALMAERLTHWASLADAKLADTDAEIFVAPGNDDPHFIDSVLARLPRFRLVEGQVIQLAGGHPFEMLSTGYTNKTPWDTHRELEEDELADRLDKIFGGVTDVGRSIFNIHVPPYGSHLDDGPLIDKETKKMTAGIGQQISVPVGSHACRSFIEQHQPMLSLHGHIHESRAAIRLGRTVSVNPGSDYGDGILRGALIQLSDDGEVLSHQLTSG